MWTGGAWEWGTGPPAPQVTAFPIQNAPAPPPQINTKGIPEGVVNIVSGFGPTAGAALVEHPGVDKVGGPWALGRLGGRAEGGVRRGAAPFA